MTATYYTPLISTDDVDAATLNAIFQDFDDVLQAVAAGGGILAIGMDVPPGIGDTTPGAGSFADLEVTSDPASGTASRLTLTNATDTPTSDPGWTTSSTVNMSAPDGYVKAYGGTQAVVIPYWNT